MVEYFAAAVVFYVVTAFLDITATVRGIAKKLGVEGNNMIVALFGAKPSARQLVAFDAMWSGIPIATGIAGLVLKHYQWPAVFGGFLIGYGVRHAAGYFKWRKLGA